MKDSPGPFIGDVVAFRSDVFVGLAEEGDFATVRAGTFEGWLESTGEVLACVMTTHGGVTVRWSMIEGLEGPEGLL